MTHPSSLPSPVRAMTCATPGISLRTAWSLATCSAFSAKTIELPESVRM